MSLEKKQVVFHKPLQISKSINEGLRAIAENYAGNIQHASNHCLDRVAGLTEARLIKIRGKNPPSSTRDGQSFVTLIWVILIDGIIPNRKLSVAREWLLNVITATDLIQNDFNEDDLPTLTQLFAQSITYYDDLDTPRTEIIIKTLSQLLINYVSNNDNFSRFMPSIDRLFIGRQDDIVAIHQRIGIGDKIKYHPLTIIRGWPGVGKTALINEIAHDKNVNNSFSDGLLWASIGRYGDILDTFRSWARQLGAFHLLKFEHLSDVLEGLRLILAGRNILIIVDDIWTEEQGLYIKKLIDFTSNTLLLTTRFTDIANKLKDIPNDIYILKVLSEIHAMELLNILAPEPTQIYKNRMHELIKILEGLPLALRVAGPTLQYYYDMHLDVDKLLDEFENDYNRLLKSSAPTPQFDEKTGKTPTIELLFQRSVETLSLQGQEAFIALGVFKHKPATFDAKALQSVWEIHDPNPLIQNLIGRGLMDPTSNKRYHVHQTLHMYANKLLDNYEAD